jgi:hypothetical protein
MHLKRFFQKNWILKTFFRQKQLFWGKTFLRCTLSLRNVYVFEIYTKKTDMTHSEKKKNVLPILALIS